MILHVNHLPQSRAPASTALLAALFDVLEEGHFDPSVTSHLHVHLDWIQYRSNFRECVTVRRGVDGLSGSPPPAELAVDLRQMVSATLRGELSRALAQVAGSEET